MRPSLLEPVAASGIPVVSDAANVLLGLTTDVSVLTIVAFATVPITAWVLWRTRLGLRIRFAGEAPDAEDALGVSPEPPPVCRPVRERGAGRTRRACTS